MGQQFVRAHLDIKDNPIIDSKTISSIELKDEISFFYPLKSSTDRTTIDSFESNLQKEYIQLIQKHLFLLTKSSSWEEMNVQIDEKFIAQIANFIAEQSTKISEETKALSTYREELHTSLKTKLEIDNKRNVSIFAQTSFDSSSDKTTQLTYFAIQSLVSMLLILIKSAEKNDPTIVYQILTLADQLCGQLPVKCLPTRNNFLYTSITPLTSYISDLSLSTDPLISKQTTGILLSFAIAKGSFKELFTLVQKLIFNTTDTFNVHNLIMRMNDNLTESILDRCQESNSLIYLKSIDVFPTTQLMQLNDTLFTGQFISSIILSHIDIENELNPANVNSLSCEFHSTTFQTLFTLLEQLASSPATNVLTQLFTVCLRLFTTHLQLLVDLRLSIDVTTYVTDNERHKWLEFLLKLVSNGSVLQIAREASKALVNVLNISSSSFITEKLTFIHQHIVENKQPILIEQFFIELNKTETLLNWIDSLHHEQEKIIIWPILYALIDRYFHTESTYKPQLETMLLSFEYLLLSQLMNNKEKKTSIIIIDYLSHILKISIGNDLVHSILLGLCYLTEREVFVYEEIEPIFLAILPLLAEYQLQHPNDEYRLFLASLIGRMSQLLIIGVPQDALEIQYVNSLKSPIFTGGYISDQQNDLLNSNLAIYSQLPLPKILVHDKDFLMSIFHHTDDGARLISKLKSFSKGQQRPLLKSIEQQATDACAAILAVYIKHYRRVNLAKAELVKGDDEKPSRYLLSLYEHANRIQTFFALVKGQGGDCDELYQQIQSRASFLLFSIEESDFIPVIVDDHPVITVKNTLKTNLHFQRQRSRWSKAMNVLKLLKNLFQACVRFKKLMLEKKRMSEEKYNYENIFNRALEHFIYGDFAKSSTAIGKEEKQVQIETLERCLQRQHRRAMIRLITYRFMRGFLGNLIKKEENSELLCIYLPYLRKGESDWSYFDHIQASNNQLRKAIATSYYSIVQLALPLTSQLNNLAPNLFYLLSLSGQSIDLLQAMIEPLFLSFNKPLYVQFIAFNWFRFYVFQLCESMDIDKRRHIINPVSQEQQTFVFHTLILNAIKSLKESLSSVSDEQKSHSLKDISLAWFLQTTEPTLPSELYVNQYLAFLLRSIRFYHHVLSVCATVDYLQELLHLYDHTPSNVTRLLLIKLLGYLIPSTPDDGNGIARNLIEKFLVDTLTTIGAHSTAPEILEELIDMYRTIMSINSSWQIYASQLVSHSIQSHLNLQSIEMNETKLIASLAILGGYIESYRLGSLVKIESNDEPALALIIGIEEGEKPYRIQYFQTDQIESVAIDKLRHASEIQPPTPDDSILDTLGNFIQIDSSNNDSLLLSQLKRRAISVLYHLLTKKKSIEIFLEKPYASVLAQLCLPNSAAKTLPPPKDLRVVNQQHLEQYSLSLDRCQIIEDEGDKDQEAIPTSNRKEITPDPLVFAALAAPINGWKAYASQTEIDLFKKGRIGNEEISIVPLPRNITDMKVIEECGDKHKFRGRIAPTYESTRVSFPTFIPDNLQFNEGKWYYCVRLPVAGVIQIGWATKGFSPAGGVGVGDDRHSWSYDGSRGVLFYEEGYYGQFDDVRWKENDVCGCGIEIDGDRTNIKYWLNGKLLGTAFTHNTKVPLSSTKCNLLPNGPTTTYYPAVTIQWSSDPLKYCELIVSPEDMQQCPLPAGYKPLLLPKLVQMDNSLVNYPSHAYLVGDNAEDFFLRARKDSPSNMLRDLVHAHHLQTTFQIEDRQLILPADSDGLLLSLDNEWTVSFDFQLLSTDEKPDFPLIKCNSTEIRWPNSEEKQHCAVVFLPKEQQIKVYTNQNCRTFDHHESMQNSTIHILPRLSARLKNLAIWKYALPEEQISRLFTYGLFYIISDAQQLKEYRKRVNKISFAKDQTVFTNELLIPFHEPLTVPLWEQKKKQADEDESNYFKSHEDHSTIELFGHQTYLVLNKSTEDWSNYTLVLDLLIPHRPKTNEILTIIAWNAQRILHLQHDGKLCLDQQQSSSTIEPNQSVRLSISLQKQSLQIYLNDQLEIQFTAIDDQLTIKSDHIDLFREIHPTKNTTDSNTLRLSLKSITYLDRLVPIDQLQSARSLAPPLELIAPSLIAMGYKKNWIESVIEQNPSSDLPTILWEQRDSFIQMDLENERQRCRKIFSQLNSSIKSEVLDQLLLSPKLDTSEQTLHLAQGLVPHLLTPSSSSSSAPPIPSDLTEWIRDETQSNDEEENIYQLLDLSQSKTKKSKQSLNYSHEKLSAKQFLQARLACEHGLMMIYARSTILNMLQVWSEDNAAIFPLEKLGDYSLLKFLVVKDDRISSLIKSMLRVEMKELRNVSSSQPLLFNYLRKEISIQSLEFLIQPSLIVRNIDPEVKINEQQKQEPNLQFILQILQLFTEFFSEETTVKPQEIDFPPSFINLIFQLFLSIPTHGSKICILHFFTTLIRINDNFTLNEYISQFMFQLLSELSSDTLVIGNYARKKLQVALTDFIFVLLRKANNSMEEYRSKLPKNLQDLFMLIDVIEAWIDPTKQKTLPQAFLTRSDKFPVTADDFTKANTQFNRTADEELIHLMNNSSSLNESMASYIQTLPTGPEPDTIFYKNYITLSKIPAATVYIRAKLIYLLNRFIEANLSSVDLSLSSGQSFLTDQIRTIKFYLISPMKLKLLDESLEKTETNYNGEWNIVTFDTVKASTESDNSEHTMFYQAYQQLHSTAQTIFRQPNDQLWHAQYLGMHSTDQGGPYRDSITRICADICSTRLSLFILCPNGRTNISSNRDCWIPNVFPPNQSIAFKLQKQYRFVGQLFGMAIRRKHYLDMKFPVLLWKGLLQEEITVEDIEAIDIQSFRMINEMEKNIEQIKSMEVDQDMEAIFSSIMSELHFDVVSSGGQTFELVPGGSDMPITAGNFKDYCAAYRQYRLKEFNRQIDLISQGLRTIVPSYYLNLLTAKELEEAVCGKGQIDIELLKRNTTYGSPYNANSPVIERFWTVLNEMFTVEQRKLLLIFVWGRSTLPSRDADFTSRFTIEAFDASDSEVDRALPRSHTCFFAIDLPAYTSAEIMHERLNYAITCCSSIDGDGNMNDAPDLGLLESDESSEEL